MAALYFKYGAYSVAEARESMEEARRRIVRIVDDSSASNEPTSAQVQNPSPAWNGVARGANASGTCWLY